MTSPRLTCYAPRHGRLAALPSLRRLASHPVDATLATVPEGRS